MSQLKVNSIVDAAGGSSAVLYGVASPPNSMGFRNRIINGEMRIDQRNAGASVTPTSNATYQSCDRWMATLSPSPSRYSLQQNAGAVTPPAGFANYLGVTSLAATSLGATDNYAISQQIEGYNIADLAWGTANAQPITISFWVRSSLTGTFGGAINNSGSTRSYPFSFTISAANTWEQKTLTIAGDTSGTWLTTNGIGMYVVFSLGCGTTRSGTAGAWNSNWNFSATGATSVVGTSGATFYITGVQLEAGSVASPFERRDYGRELMMCQRYLPAFNGVGPISAGWCSASNQAFAEVELPVAPRTAPTGITLSSASHFGVFNSAAGGVAATSVAFNAASMSSVRLNVGVSSGLVAGNATGFTATSASSQLLFTGCEL
jgi:hypothetical protein